MSNWVVNAIQNLKIDPISPVSLIPSDRDNFLTFLKYLSPFSTCWLWVAVISNLSWRRKICRIYCFDTTYWLVSKQESLYPGSSSLKKSQTWDLSMCQFFATPSHKGPCPLKQILSSFIGFIIYVFIPRFALFTFTDWFMKEYKCKIYIASALYQLTPHQIHVISMRLAW